MKKLTQEDSPTVECRACLQVMNADSSFFNIFNEWIPPWDGMESTIAEDLAKLANIQILESDKHSHMICETCCQVLLTACSFTEIVRKNDKILRERYSEDVKDPENDRICDIEIKQEVKSDEECSVANGLYKTYRDDIPNLDILKIEPEEMIQQQPSQIQITVNGILPNEPGSEPMEECDAHLTNGISDSGDGYLEGNVKSEPESEEDDTDPISSDLSPECMLCAKTFNSVTGLKTHVIAQYSYKSVKRKSSKCKYVCAICRRRRDDEATTSTSTGSRGPRRKNAQYYRDYRARKRVEQEKESLNRTSDSSTIADSSTINVAGSVTLKKRKLAAEYQREYRARKKTKRDNISTGGFTTTHQSTIVDQLTTVGSSINPQTTAGSSINPQTTTGSSINPPNAGPSTSSDIGFAKPTRRKTPAEYQREYRARKKAQRESTRAAKIEDGLMEIANENTSNVVFI